MPEGSTGWGDQGALSRFRSAADQARYYENMTDVDVFEDPRYQHFYQTGEYRPSSQAYPENELLGANFGQGAAAIGGGLSEGSRTPSKRPQTPTDAWNTVAPVAPAAPPPMQLQVERPWSETNSALIEQLMQRARQGTAVNRNDPNIRAQVDPMTAQMERASRNYLDDLAERGMGRPINLQGEQRLAAERLGQQAGTMEAQIIGREIGARREEIAQALQLWGSMMSEEQRLALQQELGYMDDAYRRQALAQSGDQFMRDLALREWMANNDDYYWRSGLRG